MIAAARWCTRHAAPAEPLSLRFPQVITREYAGGGGGANGVSRRPRAKLHSGRCSRQRLRRAAFGGGTASSGKRREGGGVYPKP